MRQAEIARLDPRSQIMEVAVRLFAERGLYAVTVRDITREAQVNVGAISYHFGSKEGLVCEIFEKLLGPVQLASRTLLKEVEKQADDGPLDLEQVLRALIEPGVGLIIGGEGPQMLLPRLLYQGHAASQPFLNSELAEKNDRFSLQFIRAMARALPDMPYEEICWRYNMVVGSMLLLLTDFPRPQRLKRLSDGLCQTDNSDYVIEELIAFCLHGMRAPAPSLKRRDPPRHLTLLPTKSRDPANNAADA